MFYIGISAYYHESSIFLTDGININCFLKEEYFSRIKGDKSFPKKSLGFLIEKYSLEEKNIKNICFYEKPFKSWWEVFSYSIKEPFKNRKLLTHHLKNFNSNSIFFYTHLNKILKIPREKIIYSSHHLSHCLYGSLYTKNIYDYVYVTCDGVGEGETMSIYTISEDNKITKHWANFYPNSAGLFYSAITEFLGYEINNDEFKVMSLSSYGDPIFEKEMEKIFDPKILKINMNYFEFHRNPGRSFSNKFIDLFGEPYLNINSEKNFKKYTNIASSAQNNLEKSVNNLILKAMEITRKTKIVLTGGVALNCKMIHQLSKNNTFEKLVIPPSPGDSGSAIGASNFSYFIENKKFLKNISLFPGPDKRDINKNFNLKEFFNKVSDDRNIVNLICDRLEEGKVIATYFNNTETGPRALGNTSIICNAKDKEVVINLNSKIKKREYFQPLAPILLEEDFDKYFIVRNCIKENLFSMGTLCEARKELYNNYESVIHVDGTSRAQIITENNKIIFDILKCIKKREIDLLINTSFNISKDPMVFDLFDVYVNMRRMDIRYVAMDNGLYETKQI